MFSLRFCSYNGYQMFPEGEAVPSRAKKNNKVLVLNLFPQIHLKVLNIKKLHNKLP